MASVTYLGIDPVTQGTWIGNYGSEGYYFPQIGSAPANSDPSYTTLTTSGNFTYNWSSSTSETRALQIPSSDRQASCWASDSTFDIVFDLGSNTKRFALYFLDYDNYNGGRVNTVTVKDAGTSATLDTRTVSGFQQGSWLRWEGTGNLQLTLSYSVGNAVVSMVAFGPVPIASIPAQGRAYLGLFARQSGFGGGNTGSELDGGPSTSSSLEVYDDYGYYGYFNYSTSGTYPNSWSIEDVDVYDYDNSVSFLTDVVITKVGGTLVLKTYDSTYGTVTHVQAYGDGYYYTFVGSGPLNGRTISVSVY